MRYLNSPSWRGCEIGVMLIALVFLPRLAVGQPVEIQKRTVNVDIGGAHTALGDQIRAQARYIQAAGMYLESAATARKIGAEAAALEIENSVKAVQAFWDRRRIWEEEYRRRNPTPMEREAKIQEMWQKRMREQYQAILRSDVTDQLNWLLREVSVAALAAQYSLRSRDSNEPSSAFQIDMELTKSDINQIWLTDGGRGGAKFVFRLAEPKPMETRWPVGLRAPEFKEPREAFEAARQAVMEEADRGQGPVGFEQGKQLMKTVNDLLVALDNVYSKEQRAVPSTFLEYSDSKRFLQSLLMGVARTTKTNDLSLFKSENAFKGKTVLDLIQYMYQNGLLFAKSPEGGEGAYGRLFQAMRNMYVLMGDKSGGATTEQTPSSASEKPSGPTVPF
jgi:hypothetical protein